MAEKEHNYDGAAQLNASVVNLISELNRPKQFQLLEQAVVRLGSARSVTHLLVRGSFASGLADRSSDVDLVIGVKEGKFEAFLSVLEALMRTEFVPLFAGWPDTMVGDMGGRGFVFLAPVGGVLCQLDIYVTTEPNIADIVANGATILTDNSARNSEIEPKYPRTSLPVEAVGRSDCNEELIVEALVVFYMLSKRVLRGQSFIVYGQAYMLNDTLRRLMKQVFAPRSRHWGWYNLDADISAFPKGRECLAALGTLTSAPLIRDRNDLRRTFEQVMTIVASAAPLAVNRLAPSIDAYRYYMGLG